MTRTTTDRFDHWVEHIRPKLLRSATRLLKDAAEAENVVQATLAAVWQAHRAGHADDLDAYAKRAIWINALRRRARWRAWEPLDAVDERPDAVGESLVDGISSWELEQAIAGLPAAQQVVIRLRFYGGLSFKEIGQSLSISMNTAASRCRYGVSALRGALAKSEEEKE